MVVKEEETYDAGVFERVEAGVLKLLVLSFVFFSRNLSFMGIFLFVS